MLKEYVDSYNLNVRTINVISSVAKNQRELICDDIDCEEMSIEKSDPTSSNLHNSDILKDLDK